MVAEKWGIATDGSEKMLETRPSIDRIRIRTKFAEIPASMWPRLFDRGRGFNSYFTPRSVTLQCGRGCLTAEGKAVTERPRSRFRFNVAAVV